MKKIIKYIKHPSNVIVYLMNKGHFKWLNDETYLKIKYRIIMNKKLNLNNPETFNEKLQWLKLYDRKPEYTNMVDKYEAKKYVENIIGEEYIIPTLGVWEKFEDIDFEKLPNQFVLKPTHTSGNVFICKDKNKIDYKKLKKEVNQWLKRKYYYIHREWPYKNIQPRILCEKYIEEKGMKILNDYKFFCFNGKVKTILVCSNRNGDFKNTDFYNVTWNKMNFTRENYTNNTKIIEKPKKLEEMINISETLAKDIPFVRVDLYEVDKKVFFGELTFYPSSGFEGFKPSKYDRIFGDMIIL